MRKNYQFLDFDRRDLRLTVGLTTAISLLIATLTPLLDTENVVGTSFSMGRYVRDAGITFALTLPGALVCVALYLVGIGEIDRWVRWFGRGPAVRFAYWRKRRVARREFATALRNTPLTPGNLMLRTGALERFIRRVNSLRATAPSRLDHSFRQLEARALREKSIVYAYATGPRCVADVLTELRKNVTPAGQEADEEPVFFAYRGTIGDSFLRTAVMALEVRSADEPDWLLDWVPTPRLLRAPAWAYPALLDAAKIREEMLRGRADHWFSEPYPASGLEPEDVLALWDPYGDGPFHDLAEVVRALPLL